MEKDATKKQNGYLCNNESVEHMEKQLGRLSEKIKAAESVIKEYPATTSSGADDVKEWGAITHENRPNNTAPVKRNIWER